MPATGKRGRRLMGEINVVPYIDVMLVLLIIFMVTAPLLTQGVQVDLPKAAATPLTEQTHAPLVVSIDRHGRLYVNVGEAKQRPVDEQTLATSVRTVLGRAADTPVLLKADQSVPYGRVIRAMVLLQQAGAPRVGFLTDPLPPAPTTVSP
ncbi:MAG TPA: protein TolR [Steroidobacteraceae bacterium]|nr:protein TolR [Steroidobacteraceae bacterium]